LRQGRRPFATRPSARIIFRKTISGENDNEINRSKPAAA
jgi:hypothetical protein